MIIINIIAFIFAIGVIILIHEAGHFYFAKKAGILCHEFSIGMGPVLWQKRKGETMISIRAIPIGGYVAMADSYAEELLIKEGDSVGLNFTDGAVSEIILDKNVDSEITGVVKRQELLGIHGEPLEIEIETDDGIKTYSVLKDAFIVLSYKNKIQLTPYERSFESKKLSQRFLTISAGVIMNFVLAIFLYLLVSFISGVPSNSNSIGKVSESYPASTVLKKGDVITKICDKDVSSWEEFEQQMKSYSNSGETDIKLTYIRNGVTKEENIGAYIVLNNFGISNIDIKEEYKDNHKSATGVQVGNLGLKYGKNSKEKDKLGKNEVALSNGDYLTEIYIDGKTVVINSWKDVVSSLCSIGDDEVVYITYKFYSQELNDYYESQTPVYSYSDKLLESQNVDKVKVLIGVSPEYHFDFGKCTIEGLKNFKDAALLIFRTLKELISPSANVREVGVSDLSGVVGIFGMVKQTLSAGFLSYLTLIALLSVNIGVMNFLPIPALDGGRAVFLIYEGITHKKPNKKFESMLNNIVFILLLILFVFVTWNDILRLFRK